MQLSTVVILPQIITSGIRQLQWSINWNQKQYSEASLHKDQAWQFYNDAVDNNESKEQIDDLYAIVMMFEAIAKEAWYSWQNAKRDYLALMN
jgi:hypothetical protein